jgi:two-component system phosphate regulon sensor histidine kinase PhoR
MKRAKSLNHKLFQSIAWTAVIILATALVIIIPALSKNFADSRKHYLKETALVVRQAMNQNPDGRMAYLKKSGQKSSFRMTWIAKDGKVLYDNEADVSKMGNHKNRPEVKTAMKHGEGSASRFSKTLSESTDYCAMRLNDGSIIRVAQTRLSTFGVFGQSASIIAFLICAVVAIAFFMAGQESKSVVDPIINLNIKEPLDNDTYEELMPLLQRLNLQHQHIEHQFELLKKQQNELEAITSSMRDGLVIISHTGKVLSVNGAARQFFGLYQDRDPKSMTYLHLDHNLDFLKLIRKAMSGESSEMNCKRDGRYYQLIAGPGETDGGIYGAVLFIIDETDRQSAERLRREFTANVSHELKTPLTSILGYAEIIGNGIADQDDIPKLSQKIIEESKRLLKLISDILRLSQLDEMATDEKMEQVDLLSISKQVIHDLEEKAKKNNVTLEVSGGAAPIQGMGTTLYEMIYNLVDNAIAYNRKDGWVKVAVSEDAEETRVAISDSGIGIALDDQPRIYERFFRADPSHSKATGGTGLGLSIVKHGAMMHHATIDLDSELGKGSTFTIRFPKMPE